MDYEKEYKAALERCREFYAKLGNKQLKEEVEDIFPELKESEDERIRKAIVEFFELQDDNTTYSFIPKKNILAWLEKQGEHANFRNKIQIGDKVTRNEDGVLVNLSQLKRVAKKDEKQGKQKPAGWSEEDEYKYNTILHHLDLRKEKYKKECNQEEKDRYQCLYDWLKSLKDRYTWKPCDYELEVLRLAAEKDGTCLMGLYEQLKKLREE